MARNSSEDTMAQNDEQDERLHWHGDGGESGRKKHGNDDDDDKSPVGFFHKNLSATRKDVFKNWALTTLILAAFILAVLSLYWGALFHVEQNLGALVVWVVDFDAQVAPYTGTTALVGPTITQSAMKLVAPSGSLGWVSVPASQFNYDPMEVRQQIYNFKAWAAVIINANATSMLQSALQTGNASYDPMGAAQMIYVSSRDDTSYYDYILPQLEMFSTSATAAVGQAWASQALAQVGTTPSLLANLQAAPQAISPAIGFSTFDLRPFNPPTVTPAESVGLIYLIIIAFFSFTFYLPHHQKFVTPEGHRPLKFTQFIIWRWVATITAYFLLSLAYSLVSLAFQIPFSAPAGSDTNVVSPANAYHAGSFPVYWMLNWVGMAALGLACENVAMVIGQPWTALWLIFWVISNVSTSFYNIDLAPRFYYWGYAWPLHNLVEASRQILFNLHSRIGLNFGVLFAWVAVNTLLFPFACLFAKKMMEKSKKKEQEKKESEKD